MDAYVARLCAEIQAFDFSGYAVQTIYLGGGTPSLLSTEQLQKIFAVLPTGAHEITLEANPNSFTPAKCRAWRALGVNRLSIGVQSFDDATLRNLGRLHDVKQAFAAIKIASLCFENLSIDLIKDIPGHAFTLPPDDVLKQIKHISIYSLTRDDQPVLETDEAVKLPRAFQRYEVSNYARAGYESQHNLTYWTGGEYIGFGAGAHSLLNNQRFHNSDSILTYHRIDDGERDAETARREQIMLGLRLRTGFERSLLINKDAEIELLRSHGLIKLCGQKIIATAKGIKLLNQLWLKLV